MELATLMSNIYQVWDHISGKLKKDLQYQAEVSDTLFFNIIIIISYLIF